MSGLAFEGVACARGGRMLFAHTSFAVGLGEALVVTGPNGAGKSSLLRLAAGLMRPAAGRVTRAATIALLGEQAALDPDRTLTQALAFWAAMDGGSDRTDTALAALDLQALADVPVRLLSTGQRRRGGLARVAASGAALWLLDEPASGLDAAAVDRLEALVAAHRAGGGSVVAATHQPLAIRNAQALVLGT